ncbi:MAG: putative adhesin [Clostridiales bacterium]|nr:putative adhesin [Clostridiales bacterium]
MKKASLVIIIVAISMIIVGATLGAISLAQGAKYHRFFNVFRNDEPGTYEEKDSYSEFSDIKDINIDIGAATLKLLEGDDFEVVVNSNNGQTFEIEEVDGTLNIIEKNTSNWVWDLGNDIASIEVYVPSGFIADSINIESGAASILVDSVVSKSTALETGAGTIEVKDIKTENLSIEVGAGKVDVDGVVNGDINIDCSVGKVDLNLEGNEDDYRVEGSVSVGSFKFNNNSYGGVFDSNFSFGDGDYRIIVGCEAGSIQININ